MTYEAGLEALIGIAFALMVILPVSWKWQLGMRRTCLFVITAGAISSVFGLRFAPNFLLTVSAVGGATILISCLFLLYRFYRDPERCTPDFPGAIVSPADGVVVYVKRSEQGSLPVATKQSKTFAVTELLKTPFYSSEAWVIGISMNLLDVHVNRAPIAGVVTFQKRFPGRFGSLRLPECVFENERATTIIRAGELQIAIVQIASRLVRQIVSYVTIGESLSLGQRLGAIRLGSQVDLVMPVTDSLRVIAKVGDRLLAGETIVATFRR